MLGARGSAQPADAASDGIHGGLAARLWQVHRMFSEDDLQRARAMSPCNLRCDRGAAVQHAVRRSNARGTIHRRASCGPDG